ncbi:MAG: hypothetical protein ACREJD_00750 [Phycisphaerales bacterium]
MTSEYDTLSTLADWSAKLAELLDAARVASDGDGDSRLAVVRRLDAFIAASQPGTDEIRQLDRVASAAAHELADRIVDGAIEQIALRTSALDSLASQLVAIRAQAEARQVPSATAISELADRLARVAEDAGAIARVRSENAGDFSQLNGRIVQLASALSDLRVAFLSLSAKRQEPGPNAFGTVIPEGSRGDH